MRCYNVRRAFLLLCLFCGTVGAIYSRAAVTAANAGVGYAHSQGSELVDGTGKPLLLRGMNLGNWLVQEGYMFQLEGGPQSSREIEQLTYQLLGPDKSTQFWQEYRRRYITREDIQAIHDMGFNSVRIPLHYKLFMTDGSEGFALVDQVIHWAEEAHLYVVLDMHCAPGGQTGTNIDDSSGYPWIYDSEQSQNILLSVWERIAKHYAGSHTVLGYDLLNEPIPHFPELRKYNSQLEPLYKRIVVRIRRVDPNHVVILGGAQWDSNFSVFGPPFDRNVMYTFHKYWVTPDADSIQSYIKFREMYHVPIWLGESGENTDEWIMQFRQVLDQANVGWAFWPYKKMHSQSSVTSFDQPMYWDEVVTYAKRDPGTAGAEKLLKERPPQEHIDAAFADLLQKIQFKSGSRNAGYLKALGMN